MGSALQVRKLRPGGSVAFAWEGEVLRCDSAGIVVRAAFNVDVVEREYVTLRRGDVFVEFYYWDRCLNIFHITAADGLFKGWYANVGLPAELTAASTELQYVDLALDVWIQPNGDFVVLDQPEFEALLTEHPHLADAAVHGRDALLQLAESGQLPRWPE